MHSKYLDHFYLFFSHTINGLKYYINKHYIPHNDKEKKCIRENVHIKETTTVHLVAANQQIKKAHLPTASITLKEEDKQSL